MKTVSNLIHRVTALLILLALLSACVHKDLVFNYADSVEVELLVKWQKAPEEHPKSMSVYFFPENQADEIRFDISNSDRGKIRLPFGNYDSFCLNSDTQNIIYSNDDQKGGFEVTTPCGTNSEIDINGGVISATGISTSSLPRVRGTEKQPFALQPDLLWSSEMISFALKETEKKKTIVLYPRQVVCQYTVEVRHVSNLKYTADLFGCLTSLSSGLYLETNKVSEELVTIPFAVEGVLEKDSANGKLNTFGRCPDGSLREGENRQHLVFYTLLDDGQKFYYSYDVTDQIVSAPDPLNVHIVIDELKLPKPITNGGGFHPSVDDWENIKEEITM